MRSQYYIFLSARNPFMALKCLGCNSTPFSFRIYNLKLVNIKSRLARLRSPALACTQSSPAHRLFKLKSFLTPRLGSRCSASGAHLAHLMTAHADDLWRFSHGRPVGPNQKFSATDSLFQTWYLWWKISKKKEWLKGKITSPEEIF